MNKFLTCLDRRKSRSSRGKYESSLCLRPTDLIHIILNHIMNHITPIHITLLSLDEKEPFIDGEPAENFLKNDFNEEYKIDLSTVKYVAEKGFFHIFGEFFTSEISFLRNDSPDKTECTLSLGEKAGQSTCPEQESFLNR